MSDYGSQYRVKIAVEVDGHIVDEYKTGIYDELHHAVDAGDIVVAEAIGQNFTVAHNKTLSIAVNLQFLEDDSDTWDSLIP